MRTKTLLLSGVVAALTSASLMAQVYSLNAVGYINVTIPLGFSIVANQLNTSNNNLSPLLDSQIPTDGVSGLNSCTFFKWQPAISNWLTLQPDYFSTQTFPWDQQQATNTTLNPGEAVFVNNLSGAAVTITFVGTVLQGPLTNTALAGPGFNLASSMVPQAGRLDVDLGLPEVDNDIVYVYNPSTSTQPGWQTYNGDEFATDPQGQPWDGPGGTQPANPTVGVGQGFFYRGFQNGAIITNPGTTPGTAPNYHSMWTRTFDVN